MAEETKITNFTIYQPDGTEIHSSVVWPERPGFKLIARLVNPLVDGDLEHVTVLDPAKKDAAVVDPKTDRRDMFVDEMGHIHTIPKPRNDKATAIYRANWLRAHPGDDPESLPWIAGTAVLFDRIVWF